MHTFSLYIHYPFCIKRCAYCGFATAVEKEDLAVRYREVLLLELNHRSEEFPWKDSSIETIYFGGGTPSLMPPNFVREIIDLIGRLWLPSIPQLANSPTSQLANFPTRQLANSPFPEITLEANPETRDINAFSAFRDAGVNRLSIGAQSFDFAELKLLSRAHSAEGVEEAVALARQAGFDNLSLDLIYGVPGQSVESFRRSVEKCLDLGVEHLSAYTLSIEEGTPFARSIKEKRLPYPDPDLMADQYAVLIELMRNAGFDHYELTNYAKPGFYSRHNSAYWQRTPYLGVGCGAHSFDGSVRFWNRRDTRKHITAVLSGHDPREGEERLTLADSLEEELYLALRQAKGLPRESVDRLCRLEVVAELLSAGFISWKNDRLCINEERWLMLDEIVLRLQK